MNAESTRTELLFQGLDGRDVVGRYDGGEITSDAGGVLLHEVEQRTRILGRLNICFTDHRDPDRIDYSVRSADQAASIQAVPGLRGSQRPRRVVPGLDVGAIVRPGRPDARVPAPGVGSRQSVGGSATA